jgi:hypothetical protein
MYSSELHDARSMEDSVLLLLEFLYVRQSSTAVICVGCKYVWVGLLIKAVEVGDVCSLK